MGERRGRARTRAFGAVAVFLLVLLAAPGSGLVIRAESFADPAFRAAWERTDKLVADGTVRRSFYWGPTPGQAQMEQYAEGPGGQRLVQYFDKSRMEINDPNAGKNNPFYVTNGLLTVELVTGMMQTGNNSYSPRYPARIPLASDTDDPAAPTYETFGKLMARVDSQVGKIEARSIDRAGNVTPAASTTYAREQAIAYYAPATGHNVPQVFWDFLNASGPVWSGGRTATQRLSDPWFYAAGLPISEAYWARVKIAGSPDTAVYVQAYQRRVLTFVPSLPAGFQVQMGNIGQHYHDWRYLNAGQGGAGTLTPQPTPTGQSGRLSITGAVSVPLALDAAALAARNPQTLAATFSQAGGTDSHTYQGPLLIDLLREAGGQGKAGRDLPVRYVVATGQGWQRAVLSWAELDPIFAGTKAIAAFRQDGANLQGPQGPARLVVPSDKTAARSLYGVTSLEVRVVPTGTTSGNVLHVGGAVGTTLNLTASDLASRNPVTVQVSYMSGGATGTYVYKGVPLLQLLNEAGVRGSPTTYIVARGNDGRQAVISWGEIDPALAGVRVLVAYEVDSVPMGGGIPRLVVPSDARGGRYLPYLTYVDVRDATP